MTPVSPVNPDGGDTSVTRTLTNNNIEQASVPARPVDYSPLRRRRDDPKARQRVGGGGGRAPRRPSAGQGEMLFPIHGSAGKRPAPAAQGLHVRLGDNRRAVALCVDHLHRLWLRREGGTLPDYLLDQAIKRPDTVAAVALHPSPSEVDDEDKRPPAHAPGAAPAAGPSPRNHIPADHLVRSRKTAARNRDEATHGQHAAPQQRWR